MRNPIKSLGLVALLMAAACDLPSGPSPIPGPRGGVVVQQDSGQVEQARPHSKPPEHQQ